MTSLTARHALHAPHTHDAWHADAAALGISAEPLTRHIGAVIHGVTLNQALHPRVRDLITQALLRFQVIFFRDQPLTPAEHYRFAREFGDLHIHPIYPNVPEQPEILILDTEQNDLRDNALWHTDVSFSPTPPLGAILSAKKIPAVGGDTLWASASAAYEGLSPALQHALDGLTATHDLAKSFPASRFGSDAASLAKLEEAKRKNPPVTHPVIRTHPVTGRKSIFVNEGFTTHINELAEHESQALLQLLYYHCQKPDYTVRWRWQANDVAFWDNRSTFHYAVDDYRPAHRVMNRATIQGDIPV